MVSRRSFLVTGAVAAAGAGSLGAVAASARSAGAASLRARLNAEHHGYGPLQPDRDGLLELPPGFRYRSFSREGEVFDGGTVPAAHDGMGAFAAPRGATVLVRNHELDIDDVLDDGLPPVPHVPGRTYDPEALAGGTMNLLLGVHGGLLRQEISLAGTLDNCAGGITPWGTWLSCEESDDILGKPHGYVFEVDPQAGSDARPIRAMGRFEHEAVCFDRHGTAYLTEDADGPFGCLYRFIPNQPLGGRGSLHAGGRLQAMTVPGFGSDLSLVQNAGMVLKVGWVDVPDPEPLAAGTPVREQVIALGALPIPKAEGTWADNDGGIWFVSSRGDGPDADDAEDVSAAVHSGQIWRYDPATDTIELVVWFPKGTPWDEPDNITAGPHGFAVACTDGDDDQWLVGISEVGRVFPFARNALNDEEFAGACFSADGRTLYVNIQGPPGITFAISGPWWRGV